MTIKQTGNLLRSTFASWSDHNAPRLGAALAFYMLLSLAPMLIFIVTICGFVVSQAQAQRDLLIQARDLAGPAAERTMSMLIQNLAKPKTGILASTIAILTWLSGASGVFLELRDSLNTIWDVPKSSAGVRTLVWQRLTSFGMVLALGLLFLVSLLLTTTLAVIGRFYNNVMPWHINLLTQAADILVPMLAHTFILALMFKLLPNIRIAWRDALVGGTVTAVLFGVGKLLLAFYMSTVGVGSTYGAAGSLVAFVVWIYYSAQIFFFGAVLTKEYSFNYGAIARRGGSLPANVRSGENAGWIARKQSA